jgi:NosR/NirI family transcriptional regulator, nitrous oxide reductase regulator
MQRDRHQRHPASLPAFTLGLVTLAAQAVLFRAHMVSFGGAELGFGAFFAGWLAWIGVGGALARGAPRLVSRIASQPARALALYPLWMALSFLGASSLRSLAPVPAYAEVPLGWLLALTVGVTAPVSLWTGLVFTSLASTSADGRAPSLARVYALEALGAVVGGVGASVAASLGVAPLSILLLAMASALIPWAASARRLRVLHALPALALLALCAAGVGGWLGERLAEARWRAYAGEGELLALVHTPSGELMAGRRQGRTIITRDGRAALEWPDEAGVGELAALLRAQHPGAARFVLIGDQGPALAQALLSWPGVEQIRLSMDEPALATLFWRTALQREGPPPRVELVADRARASLGGGAPDLIAVLSAQPESLVGNRHHSLEFLREARARLAEGGVLMLGFTGAQDQPGEVLAATGRVVWDTVAEVFDRAVLLPGVHSLVFASDGDAVTDEAAVLVERLEAQDPDGRRFPAAELYRRLLPDEMQRARAAIEGARLLPAARVINRDEAPSLPLMGLLISLARQGRAGVDLARSVITGGEGLAWLLLGLFTLLGALALARHGPARAGGASAARLLVGAAGFASMGLEIVLLDRFQLHQGTVYLHVGLLGAAFMGGASLGGLAVARLSTAGRGGLGVRLVPTVGLAIVAAIVGAAPLDWGLVESAGALVIVGGLGGALFPLAGALAREGADADPGADARAAAVVETWDHVGAALGGALVSLWLVPVLGLAAACVLIAGIMAAAALFVLVERARLAFRPRARLAPGWRAPIWILSALILALGLGGAWVERQRARTAPVLPADAVSELAGEDVARCARDPRAGCRLTTAQGTPAGVLLSSKALAPEVSGYGGPINVVFRLDAEDAVVAWRLVEDWETPAYRRVVEAEAARYMGWRPQTGDEVEAVTRATVSSRALSQAMRRATRCFRSEIRPRAGTAPVALPVAGEGAPKIELVALALLLLGAVALGRYPEPRLRLALLTVAAGAAGVWLNLSFSMGQVLAWLSGRLPPPSWRFSFLLLVGVPAIVLLFGNVFCGHACPFGALQELVGRITGARRDLPSRWRRPAKAGRWMLLALLSLVSVVGGSREVASADPLLGVFAWQGGPLVLGVALGGLALAAWIPRAFCRYLCPTGAALSLLGSWPILSRWTRPKRLTDCPLNVTHVDSLSCIQCDRCLSGGRTDMTCCVSAPRKRNMSYPSSSLPSSSLPSVAWLLLLAGFVLAILSHAEADVARLASGGAEMRRVDLPTLEARQRAGTLSDQEALFYQRTKE